MSSSSSTDDHHKLSLCAFCSRITKAVLSRYIQMNGSNEPLRRYGHSKLSKMAACHQLGFDVTRNSAIRSANPENPTLDWPRTKHEVYRYHPLRMAIRVSWGHMEPRILGEGEFVGGQRRHHSKERWWFPIGYPLWPLRYLYSVIIRPQFAIECPRRSNQQGVGHFAPKFPYCSPWSRPVLELT